MTDAIEPHATSPVLGLPYPDPSGLVRDHPTDHQALVNRFEALKLAVAGPATFNWKYQDSNQNAAFVEWDLTPLIPASPFVGTAVIYVVAELYIENMIAATYIGHNAYSNRVAGGTPPGWGINWANTGFTYAVAQGARSWMGAVPIVAILPVNVGERPEFRYRLNHGAGQYAGSRGLGHVMFTPSTFSTMPPS